MTEFDVTAEIAREDAWSQYWQSGALHSCATSLDDQYSGAIGDFWHGVASEIPEGAAVLDIATGNGPVPKILAGSSNASTWVIRGIDLAGIHPTWLNSVSHVDVKLVGHCGLGEAQAKLLAGGDPTQFKVLTSQFGWEYITPRSDAIEQTLQLTEQGGVWRFVCHHSDGLLAGVAREEVAHIDLLLGDPGLLKSAATLLPWMERATMDVEFVRQSSQASEARNAYNDAMAVIADRLRTSQAPDLLNEARQGIHSLVAQVGAGAKLPYINILAQWRQGLIASRLRCQELLDHALSRADVEALFAELRARDPGAATDAIELRQTEGLLGWGIQVDWS